MTKIIGRLNSLGVGRESTRGTAVAAAKWVPVMELTYEPRVKTVVNEASVGRIEGSDNELVTLKYGEVKVKSKVKDTCFGYFLYSLLGSVSSAAKSAPNTSVYDHTFTVANTTSHQSLSLALKGPNDDVVIANAVMTSLKLSMEANNFLLWEAELMGVAPVAASNTASFSAENDFVSQHMTFKKASSQSGLDGASAVVIKAFDMEIKTNATLEEVLGSTAPADVLNQTFEITGSVTLTHTDSTYSDLMVAGTAQALRFDIKNTDVTIGTSSNPELKIDLYKAIINNYERKMTPDAIVEETFDFKAHLSIADTAMIRIILTNLKTSYSS